MPWMCVVPSCECYTTRRTDMLGKTYHIGVTNVKTSKVENAYCSVNQDLDVLKNGTYWAGSDWTREVEEGGHYSKIMIIHMYSKITIQRCPVRNFRSLDFSRFLHHKAFLGKIFGAKILTGFFNFWGS
jgi:hypothetical protein